MRKTVLYGLLLALISGGVPFLCLLLPGGQADPPAPTPTTAVERDVPQTTPCPTPGSAADALRQQPIEVYDAAIGQTRSVPVREFLVGAAACEMPADWPEEALMAQMVASHSYALAQGEAITVNSAQCSGWTTAEVLQSRWGDRYDEWYGHLCTLADRVADALLLYEGEPAAACYHAISCGRTEASQNVWVAALPYLQGVVSPWDRYAEDYEVTVEYSAEQLSAAVAGLTGAAPEGDAESWIGSMEWDGAGYVSRIDIGGQTLTGSQVRGTLGLRSACFAIAWRQDRFVVTTRGYGHGVGLSQQGARAMAEGGSSWQEILTYYFPGTSVEDASV